MLAYIPAFIGVTLVIGFAVAPPRSDIEGSMARTTSSNMMMQHRAAYEASRVRFEPSGNYDTVMDGAFGNLADWRTRILLGEERRLLVTYPGGDARVDAASAKRAVSVLSGSAIRTIPQTAAGLLKIEEGVETVGGMDISDIGLQVPEGTPVLVTDLGRYVPGTSEGGGTGGGTGGRGVIAVSDSGALTQDAVDDLIGRLLGGASIPISGSEDETGLTGTQIDFGSGEAGGSLTEGGPDTAQASG